MEKSKEVQKKEPERPLFEQWAVKAKKAFIRVAGEEKWNREIIFALQALRDNQLLQACKPESIQNAVINIALTGATLNPALHQAWLVPRDGKCCLDFSYRGLAKIAMDDGLVQSISAQVVYTWDEFEYEQGTFPNLHYKINLAPEVDMDSIIKDPVKIWQYVKCAFSIATFKDGTSEFIILPKWKLWKVFQSSKGKDNPKMPWHTWPEEQMRKTAIKYHSKTLQQSGGSEKLTTAVSHLNEHEGLVDDEINDLPVPKLTDTVKQADTVKEGNNKPEPGEKPQEPTDHKDKKPPKLPKLCSKDPKNCEFTQFMYIDEKEVITCTELGGKNCPLQ